MKKTLKNNVHVNGGLVLFKVNVIGVIMLSYYKYYITMHAFQTITDNFVYHLQIFDLRHSIFQPNVALIHSMPAKSQLTKNYFLLHFRDI